MLRRTLAAVLLLTLPTAAQTAKPLAFDYPAISQGDGYSTFGSALD